MANSERKTRQRTVSRRSVIGGTVATGGAIATTAALGVATGGVAWAHTLPPTVQDSQSSLYRVSSTTYGTSYYSGTYADCAVVFTAPDSGRVMIYWSGAARNTYSGPGAIAYLSFEVREGGTIGSGSVVLPPNNSRTVRTNLRDSQTVRTGSSYLLSGLTGQATYNARLLHRVTSQQGEFFQRNLIVAPAS